MAGRVGGDQTLAYCGVERRSQGRADVCKRRRGVRPSGPVGLARDPAEHRRQLGRGEVSQGEVPDVGHKEAFDVACVRQPCRVPDPGAGGQPLSQPARHRPLAAGTVLAALREVLLPGQERPLTVRVTAAPDPPRPTQFVRHRAGEVPRPVPRFIQPRAGLVPPLAGR
jgi:hypothetical protein